MKQLFFILLLAIPSLENFSQYSWDITKTEKICKLNLRHLNINLSRQFKKDTLYLTTLEAYYYYKSIWFETKYADLFEKTTNNSKSDSLLQQFYDWIREIEDLSLKYNKDDEEFKIKMQCSPGNKIIIHKSQIVISDYDFYRAADCFCRITFRDIIHLKRHVINYAKKHNIKLSL
jgi:hypothetical protein